MEKCPPTTTCTRKRLVADCKSFGLPLFHLLSDLHVKQRHWPTLIYLTAVDAHTHRHTKLVHIVVNKWRLFGRLNPTASPLRRQPLGRWKMCGWGKKKEKKRCNTHATHATLGLVTRKRVPPPLLKKEIDREKCIYLLSCERRQLLQHQAKVERNYLKD